MTGVSKYIFIFGGIKMEYEKMLGVEAPKSWTHVVREVPTVTQEQRKRALEILCSFGCIQGCMGKRR